MIKPFSGYQHHISLSPDQLLTNGEIVAIVDDDASIREPLKIYLEEQGLAVTDLASAGELLACLERQPVALVLLDIGLPDIDGVTLIPQLIERFPDIAIIMLTGVADLQVALECIRRGADDYLSKPAKFNEILFTAKKTLEKRRLIFENRKYQEDLEKAHFRIQLMHQLSLKMNSVYLSTVELDEILQAILVGITANEGLKFNRAFLAMFDDSGQYLVGKTAIGTTCREQAANIWDEMRRRELKFLDIVHNLRESCALEDSDVHAIIRKLRVPISETDNILIKSALERRSIRVDASCGSRPILLERRNITGRQDSYPEELDRRQQGGPVSRAELGVPQELIDLLQEDTFVVVPLYSPGRPFGVIIADNFVTRHPITDGHVGALELFASQASLAIEHSHLYMDMQNKIRQLEELNHELDKNKDLLVEAERFSTLGQMAAQMVHSIRNPITSIGGISRLINKKISDPGLEKYLQAIAKETGRLEEILQELYDFIGGETVTREPALLSELIDKSLLLLQSTIDRQQIKIDKHFCQHEPLLALDGQQIRQMLLYLFNKSFATMPDGGSLAITVTVQEPYVELLLRDSGTAVQAEEEDSLFVPRTYDIGMRLSIVDQIVQAHNGTFEFRKQQNGLEVKILLPIAPPEMTDVSQ